MTTKAELQQITDEMTARCLPEWMIKWLQSFADRLDTVAVSDEVDEQAKDAERYRWLVEHAMVNTNRFWHDGRDPASTKQPLDNAIDRAIAKGDDK